MFRMEIDTNDDAFYGRDKIVEICRILKECIKNLCDGCEEHNIHDINGNYVGEWKLK